MKKLHSLFILSILALTMFVGCQMPTDGTGNGAEAVETESKVNEYGFISSETYTVVFTNGSSTTMTGEAHKCSKRYWNDKRYRLHNQRQDSYTYCKWYGKDGKLS